MILPSFDPIYLLFMIPPFLLGLLATILLNVWTKQYLQELTSKGMTGMDIITKITQSEHLDLKVNLINEVLGESWDPQNHILNISSTNAYGRSITGAGIIAHELGHVLQQKEGSLLFKIRSAIIPAVNIGSNLGYFLILIGLAIQFSGLAWLGIIFFALTTVFSLLTLPIEIDASTKALTLLKKNQIIFEKETSGVKKVLTAAALTYVAALFQSLGQLLYFIFRVQGISRSRED